MRGWSDRFCEWLRSAGVPAASISTEDNHPQTLKPADLRLQPSARGVGSYVQPFYRTLFVVRMTDGTRRVILMDPDVIKRGGRWRQDYSSTESKLFSLLVADHNSRQALP